MTQYIVDFTVIIDAENDQEAKRKAIRYFKSAKARKEHIVNVEKNE